jgi:hypothetical protein
MPSSEAELAAALRQRLALIGDSESRHDPEQHLAKLKSVSEKIASLEAGLPKPVEPQLAHFLARCSYEKALALLEARDSEGSVA